MDALRGVCAFGLGGKPFGVATGATDGVGILASVYVAVCGARLGGCWVGGRRCVNRGNGIAILCVVAANNSHQWFV